ncbi:hypothetical protein [Paenibacillus sp. YAF4_2]|uniref:hypothetical protein n=1 Tax=Paenibacillus sp. YAF4_2 TaxID=3233085 RepID=UPI003F9EB89C
MRFNHNQVELYLPGERNSSQTWENHYSREQNSLDNIEQLLTWIETGAVANNSAEDNLKTVALLDASYQSAAECQIVRLKDGVRI